MPAVLIVLRGVLSLEASFESIPSAIFAVLIIAGWITLVVDLVFIICNIVMLKCTRIEFYNDRVIEYWGVFFKHKRISVFAGVLEVYLHQHFYERWLNFGSIDVDVQGRWDHRLNYIANPKQLVRYLDKCRVAPRNMSFISQS